MMAACLLAFAQSVLQDMTLSGGCPTGLEPAPSGATRGRSPFLSVAVYCRIGLSMPITLLGLRVVSACSMISTAESNCAATSANRERNPLRSFGQGVHSENTPSKRLG